MSSYSDCSPGRHGFAIGYSLTAGLFTLTIIYLVIKLIIHYRRNSKINRPPKWLFYTNLIFILISIIVLTQCIIYGLSHCEYIIISKDVQDIVFNIIFRDLYVIQLYFLWIVLFIRLYYIFIDTPYTLSKLTIRIYSIIFIFAPVLTVLISVKDLYTIFIVLGLSGGIFITLSIIILFIFKLIQVYTRYSEYQEHQNLDNGNDDLQNAKQENIGLLTTITKNAILVIISTLFSLLILFILIMNFIFEVYKVQYDYQAQFLDICLLLDIYITTICLIFQFKYLHPSYEYFCGCIDIVCRYYCNQFVNPAHLNHIHSLQPISATNVSQLPRVSIELRPPNNGNNNLEVPLTSQQQQRDAVFSESERSPSKDIYSPQKQHQHPHQQSPQQQYMLNTPMIDDSHNINIRMSSDDRHESASYDIGKKADFEDLPSLPMVESRDKATNDIKQMLEKNVSKLYIVNDKIKMDPRYNKQHQPKDIQIISPSKTRSRSGTGGSKTITQTPLSVQQRNQMVNGNGNANGNGVFNHLAVPSYSSKQQQSPNNNNPSYFNKYHGIILDQIEQKSNQPQLINRDSKRIHEVLTRNGFDKHYTKRALAVYEKHYGTNYDIKIIREIIYRLTIKDKLKELKRVQNLYQSRDAVEDILSSLNFSKHYVHVALTMYEVMAEMFEINKHHENIYDLELVTEMIMRLRAKDRERGELVEDGDNMIMHNDDDQLQQQQRGQNNQNQKKVKKPRKNTIHSVDGNANELNTKIDDNPSMRNRDRGRSKSKSKSKKKNKKYQGHEIVTAGGGDFDGLHSAFAGSVDASIPSSSDTEQDDEQQHLNHNNHNHMEQRNDPQSPNSNHLLNVINNKQHQKHHKNGSTYDSLESPLEVTVNTNDMDIDGENSNDSDKVDEEENNQNHIYNQSMELQSANRPQQVEMMQMKHQKKRDKDKSSYSNNVNSDNKRNRKRSNSKSQSHSQAQHAQHPQPIQSQSQRKHARKRSKSRSKSKSKSKAIHYDPQNQEHQKQKSGYPETGIYVNHMLQENNAILKGQHGIDSKGDLHQNVDENESVRPLSPNKKHKHSRKHSKQSIKRQSSQSKPNTPRARSKLKSKKKAKSRLSVDIDQIIYEQYVSMNGKPDNPKHLMSYAKEQGKPMKYNQAKNIIIRNKDLVIAPPKDLMTQYMMNSMGSKTSNNSTPLPDDDPKMNEHVKSQETLTTENTEHTQDQLAEVRKLQGMYHNDIHNNMDEDGNMGDDFDDTDDEEEILEMDSSDDDDDDDDDTSSDDSSDDDDDDEDDSDLMDIEDAEAEDLYSSSRSPVVDEYGLPGIHKFNPNDNGQNIMPIVPDNMPQNYDYSKHHNNNGHNQKSPNSESSIEYEEEYYDEDEFDENDVYYPNGNPVPDIDEKQSQYSSSYQSKSNNKKGYRNNGKNNKQGDDFRTISTSQTVDDDDDDDDDDEDQSSESTLTDQNAIKQKMMKKNNNNNNNGRYRGNSGDTAASSSFPEQMMFRIDTSQNNNGPLEAINSNGSQSNNSDIKRQQNGNIGLSVQSPFTPESVGSSVALDIDYTNTAYTNSQSVLIRQNLNYGNHNHYQHKLPKKARIRHKVDTKKSPKLQSTAVSKLQNNIGHLDLDARNSDSSEQ